MARYIDAEFVSDRLREVLHRPKSEFTDDFEQAINCLVYAISILKFAPTADVAPVIHAHWTNKRTDIHDGEFYCSHCGIDALWLSDDVQAILNPYCHRCGAKMDEEE